MIKNAQNSTQTKHEVGSEVKKSRKTSSGLSTLASVVRSPKGQTVETAKTAPRVVRSLGPLQSTKVLEAKSGKIEKKSPVIVKKAGPNSLGGAKFNSGDSPLRSPGANFSGSEQGRGTASKTGSPQPTKVATPREGGAAKKSGRDLRSLISVTNPERSLISAQNLPFLRRFVTEQGKILSRRLTRVTARQQREITKAIKQARILGYLQFVNTK